MPQYRSREIAQSMLFFSHSPKRPSPASVGCQSTAAFRTSIESRYGCFGVGDSGSNHAGDAVAAGREILAAVRKLNDDLAAKARAPIQIGIGIHSGPAIVGSIGSPQRLEFTAIGNTVNIASRMQGLTKTTGKPLLVTAAVRDRSGDSFSFDELPPQEVRGIDGRLPIFAVQCET